VVTAAPIVVDPSAISMPACSRRAASPSRSTTTPPGRAQPCRSATSSARTTSSASTSPTPTVWSSSWCSDPRGAARGRGVQPGRV